MIGNQLKIKTTDVAQIVSQVRSGSPLEVCGFLAGTGDTVQRVYPVHNAATNPTVRFEMNPLQQVQALIDIQQHAWDVLAVYHSHPPGSRPDPSPNDLAENTYPGALMLIALPDSVQDCVRLRAFSIDGDHLRAVEVAVIAEDNQSIARSPDWCY